MRKQQILAVMVFSALSSVSAFAQTQSGFELGVAMTNYGYNERNEGQIVASDAGKFFGVSGRYTKAFRNGAFVRGSMAVELGAVDYKADDGDTRLNDVSQTIGRLEIHAGRDFVLRPNVTVSPFAGIGSRVLLDASGGEETSSGVQGYDRQIAYRYVPVGADATFALRRDASLTVSGQYNWVFGGHAESHLSDIDPELPNVNVSLDGGSGYDISAMLNVDVRGKRFSVGPFLRGWNIHQSKSIVIDDPEGSGEMLELFEPGNRTREAGVRVTIRF